MRWQRRSIFIVGTLEPVAMYGAEAMVDSAVFDEGTLAWPQRIARRRCSVCCR